MKIRNFLPVLIAGMMLLAACSNTSVQDGTSSTQQSDKKLKVVTSFYPLAEIARTVGNDHVDVLNLVPPGAEPHDFEPSPKDILALNNADLVIINGLGFEPWADKIIPGLQQKNIKIIDISKDIPELLKPTEPLPSAETAGEEEHFVYDPHFWLDPLMYIRETQTISKTLEKIDPSYSDSFEKNTEAFVAQLQELDGEFRNGLKSCQLKEIVTNHAAFGYLAKEYGLTMVAISGMSPDAEPSPKKLAELTDLVKKDNVKIIFTETLLSPKVSDTVAKETGTETRVLNPIEGLTEVEMKNGENYISMMKKNLESLRTALECT